MIKAPNWCKDANISTRGWVDSKSGELLVSRRFSRAEVEAYKKEKSGVKEAAPKPAPFLNEVPEPAPAPQLNEVMPTAVDFNTMSKVELDEWAEHELGLQLDRRQSKAAMIAEIREHL
jgi:hypothetical protein